MPLKYVYSAIRGYVFVPRGSYTVIMVSLPLQMIHVMYVYTHIECRNQGDRTPALVHVFGTPRSKMETVFSR